MGINELLQSREYYVAAMDELDIEAELEPRQDGNSLEDPEDAAKRAALREIDGLKVNGEYERARARYWEDLGLENYQPREGLRLPAEAQEFFKRWRNLREGLNSPDPVQRERFQKFFEAANIRDRPLQQANDLIAVLEPAKKKRGRKKETPPWRNEATALEAMRLLRHGGLSIPQAAQQVALEEGLAEEESRAKYFERLYRDRLKLR